MAMFNIGCAFSNLHIKKGDKVRFFALKRNTDSDLHNDGTVPSVVFKPTDMFYPLTLAIKGTYDGLGGIKNIQRDENTEAIKDYFGISVNDFCKIANCHYNRKNSYSEIAQLLQNDNYKPEVVEKIESLKGLSGMFVLEEVYQMMINDSTLNAVKEDVFEKDYSALLSAGEEYFTKLDRIPIDMQNEGKNKEEIAEVLELAKSMLNPISLFKNSHNRHVLIPFEGWIYFNDIYGESAMRGYLKEELFASWCVYYTMQQTNLVFQPNHSSYSYTSDDALVRYLENTLEIAKKRAAKKE